jgi:calcium release-activated calcium channel protein 1
MVEISVGDTVPDALLVVFGVCTTLLVTVHLIALMISTCILPNIEAISNVHSVDAVNESPHDKMRHCVEMAWICSTG